MKIEVHEVGLIFCCCRKLFRQLAQQGADRQVFPWTKIQDAHRQMQDNKNSGKVPISFPMVAHFADP